MTPVRRIRAVERLSRIYIAKHEQLRREVVKLVRIRVKAGSVASLRASVGREG